MAARHVFILLLVGAICLSVQPAPLAAAGYPVAARVTSAAPDRIVITYSLADFATEQVDIGGRQYAFITLGEEGLMRERGAPELPSVCRSVVIPDDAEMAVSVASSSYREFADVDVAPSKGHLLRTVDPARISYTFGAAYSADAFYPGELAKLRDPYILRDHRGVVVELYPFQYNPVTRRLRYYSEVTVVVESIGPGRTNVLPMRRTGARSEVPAFRELYGRHFLNYMPPRLYTPLDESGEMRIICHDAWISNIQPLVDHKNARGITTAAVGVSTIGNDAASIKSYIQSAYDSTNLSFVLLVGDAAQVAPPLSGSDPVDPTYALVAGSDHYPDIFVGRFSAETAAQVDTQVQRTIEYENMPATVQDWFRRGTGIASDEGPGHNGEYDYQHMGFVRDDLLAYEYTSVDEIYDPGATAAQVAAAINAGRGIINYCGHGSETSWGTTGFSVGNVNALTNDNMLPFIVSVACVNGAFDGLTCFGEAWLRATNGSEPTGAIGIYASSVNQYWDPPMTAQDECTDLLVSEACHSFGALCYSGSCKMIDVHGSAGEDMFDTWHIFGDPSVEIWGIPSRGTVSFDTGTYPLDGTAAVTVRDADLDADPGSADEVTVEVLSDTESTPESLLLTETGVSTKVFSGSIGLDEGDAIPGDTLIQVHDGDTITVTYYDADDGTGNPADVQDTAAVDGTAPVISNVGSTPSTTSCTVTWQTDESADGTVAYGEAAPPGSEVSAAALVTSHSLRIRNLQPLTTYYFEVRSADGAGNTAVDDNGGGYYQFTTLEIGAVLFVDDDEGDSYESYFTDALDAGSYGYDVWDVSAEGAPSSGDLENYQVVIWNCGYEYDAANAGLTTSEQSALTVYMDNGGSVFLCGQDILYNGVSSTFSTDYLHLAQHDGDDTTTQAIGIAGDRISDGMALSLSYPFEDYSDSLSPDASSSGVFSTDGGTTYPYCAVRYPADGVSAAFKIVFFAFPFEAISQGAAAPDNAGTVMDRVLRFLSPVTVSAISPSYGLNDRTTSVTITGSGFKAGISASLGATQLSITSVTAGSVGADVPLGLAPDTYDLTVRNSDSLRDVLGGAFISLSPQGDEDGDGLDNESEMDTHGTSPFLGDTDEDGLTDGEEVNVHGTDPLDADMDDDDLLDGEEIALGTLPSSTDSDGDGVSDYLECACGGDPLDGIPPDSIHVNFQPPASAVPEDHAPDAARDFSPRGYGWQ